MNNLLPFIYIIYVLQVWLPIKREKEEEIKVKIKKEKESEEELVDETQCHTVNITECDTETIARESVEELANVTELSQSTSNIKKRNRQEDDIDQRIKKKLNDIVKHIDKYPYTTEASSHSFELLKDSIKNFLGNFTN